MTPLHDIYWELVDAIEHNCRVADWRLGDLDLWPLARQDLFLDLFYSRGGDTAPPPPRFFVRAAASLATPLANPWKSRRDLAHWVPWPRRADAVLLGDGVSLDRIHGAWHDRYGEPIVAALARGGRSTFVMQPGNLARLPWARPTFAANTVAVGGALAAALAPGPAPDLPDHAAAMAYLDRAGIVAPSLSVARLARRGKAVAAQAATFGRILRRVRPRVAFVVTHYAGLGHAFALACRRRGVLCVDLQHCPQGSAHRGYRWPALPPAAIPRCPACSGHGARRKRCRSSAGRQHWSGHGTGRSMAATARSRASPKRVPRRNGTPHSTRSPVRPPPARSSSPCNRSAGGAPIGKRWLR